MFTPEEREALRLELIQAARADPRITGGAVTGSASIGNEDRWSDIDLAFGVGDATGVGAVLAEFSERMYRNHGAIHHVDVMSGAWIYRVFLLGNTLQVDLAFVPEEEFGALAPTFRLVFGTAAEKPHAPAPAAETLIGWAWLYALHARSSIARAKPWQAEYMISGLRDHVLALACIRHGLPAREGRGMDRLPPELKDGLQGALVGSLDTHELIRAFRAAMSGLSREILHADEGFATRLERTLLDLTDIPRSYLINVFGS